MKRKQKIVEESPALPLKKKIHGLKMRQNGESEELCYTNDGYTNDDGTLGDPIPC
jgi:hypothetical protein